VGTKGRHLPILGAVAASPGFAPGIQDALMWLSEIWRYPVKSLGGERLTSVTLGRA
jgi:hypothetical protein